MFTVTTTVAFLVAAAAAAPATTTTTAALTLPFRADYLYYSSARTFYKVHSSPASWERAREICHQEGAELAVPETLQQMEALKGIRSGLTTFMWLGIYCPVRTVYEETAIHLNYSRGFGVVLLNDTSIKYSAYTSEFNFVCEILEAAVCNASVSGYTLGPDVRSCYKLHTTLKKWTEALQTCKEEGAHLAVINSQQEADHVNTLAESFDYSPFIGFHELPEAGTFITIYGDLIGSSGYDKWASGEPNNDNGTCKCGSLKSGKLYLSRCTLAKTFICEKKASAPISALPDCQPNLSITDVKMSK